MFLLSADFRRAEVGGGVVRAFPDRVCGRSHGGKPADVFTHRGCHQPVRPSSQGERAPSLGVPSGVRENRAAKPLNYAVAGRKSRLHVTLASVTMVISGTVILAFVVFHLLHFTAQVVDRSYATMETMVDGKTVHDVHRMVVSGFSRPLISGFYLLAMGLLFFHLRHGAASLCQTLGIRDRKLAKAIDAGSWILAVVLFLGFSSIPLAVLLGVWKT
ncbi:MAG: hypothetical protein EBT95_02835 [Verrucomicrobia bacterium]|nr:hypothetical protein [Verrucomicrobiota bacterium]